MKTLSVGELLEHKKESLALRIIAGEKGLLREIESAEVSSPGIALTGFTKRFPTGRIQVFGETEIDFLRSLEAEAQREAAEFVVRAAVPCLFVTKGMDPPEALKRVSDEHGIPLIQTELKTGEFYRRVKPYLEDEFAPTTVMHGSLADVYGVGLLFVGRSGIGKSECVLDLVERGHRLVADDVVIVTRRGHDVIIGRGLEQQQHHMEIRGIGIIDVRALFGIHATRQQKRIEVVVQLEEWSDAADYDRTGLHQPTTTILDVELPLVVIPLNPGKNITVIAEVVSMRHLLKYSGVDSALEFHRNLRQRMLPVREYLEEDYE
ncbi:MAG: HPr(Ser) kinase/phosphatase [Gemmatimonadota bacterium]|nr:MAG: HPr(Ser) kinase/phosphatase [Gemmatimonadota bacterium]